MWFLRSVSKTPKSPEDQRGHQRMIRAAWSGVAMLAARGAAIIVGFVTIPLTARYLKTEQFGVWLTLGTLMYWTSLVDFGLANSLTNALATAKGNDDRQQARTIVSSAFWLMVAITGLLSICFLWIYPFVPWRSVFNVTTEVGRSEIEQTALIGFFCFALRFPLGIASRIYAAEQESYLYQLWAGFSSGLSLVFLLIGIAQHLSLAGLIAVFFGAPVLVDFACILHLFIVLKPDLQPDWRFTSGTIVWQLLSTGAQFWIVQIAAIAFLQTDLVIVTQLFGAKFVATYGVALKLFSLIGTVQVAFITPLWAAYGEALARGDTAWIVNTFRRSVQWSLLWSIGAGTILSALAPWIISLWISSEVVPQLDLLFPMLIFTILLALGQCISVFLNGVNRMTSQVIFGVSAGLLNLVLSIQLGHLLGMPGVTWATNICLLVFSIGLVGADAVIYLAQLNKLGQRLN